MDVSFRESLSFRNSKENDNLEDNFSEKGRESIEMEEVKWRIEDDMINIRS